MKEMSIIYLYRIKIIDFGLSTFINPGEKLNKKAGSVNFL